MNPEIKKLWIQELNKINNQNQSGVIARSQPPLRILQKVIGKKINKDLGFVPREKYKCTTTTINGKKIKKATSPAYEEAKKRTEILLIESGLSRTDPMFPSYPHKPDKKFTYEFYPLSYIISKGWPTVTIIEKDGKEYEQTNFTEVTLDQIAHMIELDY